MNPDKPGNPDATIEPEPDALTDLARGLREATDDLDEATRLGFTHDPFRPTDATEELAVAIAEYRRARVVLADVSPETLTAFDHLFAPSNAEADPRVGVTLNRAGVAAVLPDPAEVRGIAEWITDKIERARVEALAAMIEVLGRRLQSLGFRIMFRPISKPE